MHALSVKARLEDFKRISNLKNKGRLNEPYSGCRFSLSIDCLCFGPHKFSFEYLVQELFSMNTPEKGMPLIESELRMKLDSRLNNQYRKINIIGREIPSQTAYTCRGHSYSVDDGRIKGLVKKCEGCRFYK